MFPRLPQQEKFEQFGVALQILTRKRKSFQLFVTFLNERKCLLLAVAATFFTFNPSWTKIVVGFNKASDVLVYFPFE